MYKEGLLLIKLSSLGHLLVFQIFRILSQKYIFINALGHNSIRFPPSPLVSVIIYGDVRGCGPLLFPLPRVIVFRPRRQCFNLFSLAGVALHAHNMDYTNKIGSWCVPDTVHVNCEQKRSDL